jgi:hypothetical protein
VEYYWNSHSTFPYYQESIPLHKAVLKLRLCWAGQLRVYCIHWAPKKLELKCLLPHFQLLALPPVR